MDWIELIKILVNNYQVASSRKINIIVFYVKKHYVPVAKENKKGDFP